MPSLALVGLPNVGRTTLFNALTGLGAPTAAHPFSTIEPNLGVAVVPDPLLERLAEVEDSRETVGVGLELLDLPAGRGRRLEERFLGRLREADALALVLRSFEDPALPAEESGTDPGEQAEELILQLALADLEQVERRSERVTKEATADPARRPEAEALRRAAGVLESGRPLRREQWSDQELDAFRDLAPLTLKPVVWVVNVGEEHQGEVSVPAAGDETVVALSARLEEEAARLDPGERAELYEGLGLGEGALARIVGASYRALDLITFYTANRRQAHAWTVERGATAPRAAGRIHSDMERGFIRAEVAGMQELLEAGGWEAARRSGIVRTEGKGYLVQEGDVVHVRFSV